MDVAIIGLPQSGKTTLFNALTRGQSSSIGAGGPGGQMRVGVVKVPDPRLTVLAEMYQPEKVVQAEIKCWDLPGIETSARSQGIAGRHRSILQGADAFLLVVRAFNDPSVPHPSTTVDPGRDLATMLVELAFADLEVLERATERLGDNIRKAKQEERRALTQHLAAVEKVKLALEVGTPMRRQQLTSSESAFMINYQPLSAKPVIVAFNTDESGPEVTLGKVLANPVEAAGLGGVSLCAKLEADLALMPDAEAEEFRIALGIGDSLVSRVVRVTYETLGLVSFLTIGDDEVRAWSVPSGMPAQEAAGAVHSDFQRGFIRAEVIPYDDLVRCGSIAQGRREGVLRSEGKTYPVKDGDVIDFLVNP
jgi:hypothetical protein